MYLSRLIINPICRDARRDLRNVYDLHRTLLRAFPDQEAGGSGHVLFHLEINGEGSPVVLVQSENEPLWESLPNTYLTRSDCKQLPILDLPIGRKLRFRLRANPAKRVRECAVATGWGGKRVGIFKEEEQRHWLTRRAQASGFQLLDMLVVPEGNLVGFKGGQRLTFVSARYEGILEVTDTEAFQRTLAQGLGPAKGFGFGLLSVAPVS